MSLRVSSAILIAAILPLLLSTTACRKPGKADGLVVDLLTGLPVEAALVKVDGLDRSAQTDKRGRFFLLDLKPGTYKITASKGGFLSLAQVDATVTRDAVFHAGTLELVSIPPGAGLFQPGDPPVALPRLDAAWTTAEGVGPYLESAGFPQVPSLSRPLSLVYYNGDAPLPEGAALSLHSLLFLPSEGAAGRASFTNPGRWVVASEAAPGFESRSLGPNLRLLSGEVEYGRYAMKVGVGQGEPSWYLFDVERSAAVAAPPPEAGAASAPVAVNAPAVGPKELVKNVESIRAALKDYMDAFGVYVAVKEPTPRPVKDLSPNPTAWKSGTAFDELGWAPEAKVAGTYWIDLSADGKDFTVHGVILGDDDKPVHYVATKTKSAAPLP